MSKTVNEAFNNALEQMNDDYGKWVDYVLLLNEKNLKVSDLGIISCLHFKNDARHNNKLYDAD